MFERNIRVNLLGHFIAAQKFTPLIKVPIYLA